MVEDRDDQPEHDPDDRAAGCEPDRANESDAARDRAQSDLEVARLHVASLLYYGHSAVSPVIIRNRPGKRRHAARPVAPVRWPMFIAAANAAMRLTSGNKASLRVANAASGTDRRRRRRTTYARAPRSQMVESDVVYN